LPSGGNASAPAELSLAVRAWNLMGGLDWHALPVVLELLGVTPPACDPDIVIAQLVALRDGQAARAARAGRR
jgi:hypothetical protein